MSQTSLRTKVIRRTLDLLNDQSALADTLVTHAHPGDAEKAEMVWVWQIEGTSYSITALGAGRKLGDDEFEITWQLKVANPDEGTTLDRLTEMIGAFENVLLGDPTLGFDAATDSIVSQISNVHGPVAERTGEQFEGWARVVQHCRTRLL